MIQGAILILTLCHFTALPVLAEEDSSPAALYRLEFTLTVITPEEREQARQFSLLLEEDETGKVRSLRKLERGFGDDDDIDFVEIGLKCDTEYTEENGRLNLKLELHYSYLSPGQSPNSPSSWVDLQEWQCRVETIIEQGVPTKLAEVQTVSENPGYRVEVLAEKVR